MAEFPAWSAFDPNDAPPLPEHLDRPGRIVVALATDRAQRDGWALRSTVELARAWGAGGHKIVVADTMLEAPGLHSYLGVTNTEGVTDTVMYGSSVRRVAKPAPQGSYFFVTAGSPTADPDSVLGDPRWQGLCDGFVEAGVALIALIGESSPGKGPALASATDVVVFAEPDEDVSALLAGTDAPIRFAVGPQPIEEEAVLEEPEDDSVDEPLPVEVEEPTAKGGSRGPLVLTLSVVILGIVGAATFDLVTIPGISPSTRGPRSVQSEASPPAATSTPIADTSVRLTHSVVVGAYQDAAVAEQQAAALRTDAVMAAVVPVSIDGAVFYRVVLDPAPDEAAAQALLVAVSSALGVDSGDWVVRETGLGFELGEVGDLESAQRRVEVLRELEVPAYVLAVDFVNGGTRYRVYAGAYADEEEASYLRRHLEERGLENITLSGRIGRSPE